MPSKRDTLLRDILSGLIITALSLAIALLWGGPFIGPGSISAQDEVQTQQEQFSPRQANQDNQGNSKPHPGVVSQMGGR